MRLSLALLLAILSSAVRAQDRPASASELRRHYVSTDLLADVGGRLNLRYAYRLSASGEVFAQAATEVRSRALRRFDSASQIPAVATPAVRLDAQRVTDVYLGYRQHFRNLARAGRFYVEGAGTFAVYGDFREEYLNALRALPGFDPDFEPARQSLYGFATAVGYAYDLRGGWTLEARVGAQASIDRRESAGGFRSSGLLFEATTARTSGLLTVGKRF